MKNNKILVDKTLFYFLLKENFDGYPEIQKVIKKNILDREKKGDNNLETETNLTHEYIIYWSDGSTSGIDEASYERVIHCIVKFDAAKLPGQLFLELPSRKSYVNVCHIREITHSVACRKCYYGQDSTDGGRAAQAD